MRLRLLLLIALCGCTGTPPFTDPTGHVLPGSVATVETLRLGGVDQTVWIRGRDATAPVLVILHGGPGVSEAGLFRHYAAALEDSFVVVYWDQRGTGRSWHADMPRSSLTIAGMLEDLDALVDTLRTRFHVQRVVLLGHPWGTILGTLYASQHGEKVAAYIGVAQIVNVAMGERTSLAWALHAAQARHDERAQRALHRMAPAPRSVDEELELRGVRAQPALRGARALPPGHAPDVLPIARRALSRGNPPIRSSHRRMAQPP